MKKKLLIILGFILVILIVAGFVTSYIDSARVRNSVEPKFTIKIVSEDGNKVTYWGLGYKVVLYPSVSPNEPFQNNRGVKYGSWFMKYSLDRYDEIRDEIDKELEKYMSLVSPNCQQGNGGQLITHETLVFNGGMDKDVLLDIDNESYCGLYVKTSCPKDGINEWKEQGKNFGKFILCSLCVSSIYAAMLSTFLIIFINSLLPTRIKRCIAPNSRYGII